MFTIKEIIDNNEKTVITKQILTELPEWFVDNQAVERYAREAARNVFFAAKDVQDVPVGFVSLKILNLFTGEIEAIGVNKAYHRQKIGYCLLRRAEHYLSYSGFKFVIAKTLGGGADDPWYKITRSFFYHQGFYPLQEFSEIWGKNNPCLLIAKAL